MFAIHPIFGALGKAKFNIYLNFDSKKHVVSHSLVRLWSLKLPKPKPLTWELFRQLVLFLRSHHAAGHLLDLAATRDQYQDSEQLVVAVRCEDLVHWGYIYIYLVGGLTMVNSD